MRGKSEQESLGPLPGSSGQVSSTSPSKREEGYECVCVCVIGVGGVTQGRGVADPQDSYHWCTGGVTEAWSRHPTDLVWDICWRQGKC